MGRWQGGKSGGGGPCFYLVGGCPALNLPRVGSRAPPGPPLLTGTGKGGPKPRAVGWAQADLTAWTQLTPHLKRKQCLSPTPRRVPPPLPKLPLGPEALIFLAAGDLGHFCHILLSTRKGQASKCLLNHKAVWAEKNSVRGAVSNKGRARRPGARCGCWPQAPDNGLLGTCDAGCDGGCDGGGGLCRPPPCIFSSSSRRAGQRAAYSRGLCTDLPTGPRASQGTCADIRHGRSTLSMHVASTNHGARKDNILGL